MAMKLLETKESGTATTGAGGKENKLSNSGESDRERGGLIGPVKVDCVEWEALVAMDGASPDDPPYVSELSGFDKHGKRTAHGEHWTDNGLKILFLDTNGEEKDWKEYDNHGVLAKSWTPSFDDVGRGAGGVLYDRDGQSKTIISTYTEADGMTEKTLTNADGTTIYKDIRNSNGDMIKETFWREDGSLLVDRTYKYKHDGVGNMTEKTRHESDFKMSFRETYTYRNGQKEKVTRFNERNMIESETLFDSGGRILEVLRFDDRGLIENKLQNSYNSKGQVTVKIEERKAQKHTPRKFRLEYVYDRRGNLKEAYKYIDDNPLPEKTEFKYEFDSKGNWIKKTTSDGGEDISREIRTIIYY